MTDTVIYGLIVAGLCVLIGSMLVFGFFNPRTLTRDEILKIIKKNK